MDSSISTLGPQMERLMLTVILVCIFCGVNQAAEDGQNKGNTRCKVTAVHWGGEAQLTCHYPMDLDKWSGDLNVAVQQFVGRSEIHILDCLWDEIYQCTDVRQGYKITKAAGNTMTITKANVSREQEGRYRCVLIDATGIYGFEFCNSTVTGFFTPGPESKTGADEAANGQLGFFTSGPETEQWADETATGQPGSDEGFSVGAIAAIVIGVLSVIGIVVVVFGVWRCRKRRAERPNKVKYRTTPGEGQQTENGDVPTGESTAKNRNGSSYEPDLEDINYHTKGAITSGNEGDQGRSKKQGPSVTEMVNQYEKLGGETRIDRKSSGTIIGIDHFRGVVPTVEEVDSAFMDTQSQPVVHDHPPTASLERLGNQRMENGKMAENTVHQDVASDADYTVDKVAVSTPLLSSDQRPEVEPAMDEFDPRASQSSSLVKSPPQTSQPESRYKQDLEAKKEEEKWLLRSPGLSSNPLGRFGSNKGVEIKDKETDRHVNTEDSNNQQLSGY